MACGGRSVGASSPVTHSILLGPPHPATVLQKNHKIKQKRGKLLGLCLTLDYD